MYKYNIMYTSIVGDFASVKYIDLCVLILIVVEGLNYESSYIKGRCWFNFV